MSRAFELVHSGTSMSIASMGGMVICIHPRIGSEIDDSDWDAFCDITRGRTGLRILVVAPSAVVPNASQRQRFTNGVRSARLVVMCGRPGQRIVVNMLGMFLRSVRAVQIGDYQSALAFLDSSVALEDLTMRVEWLQNKMEAKSAPPEPRSAEG